jgi:hypothetical protein
VFWVISVYFNIRNTLPKYGTFLLGHPAYIYIYIYSSSVTSLNDETLQVVFREMIMAMNCRYTSGKQDNHNCLKEES